MPTPNERLRRERQLRGWSQVHLAEQIGVPDYYISRWERGDVLPSPYYQQKLCEVFGKTAEELGMLHEVSPPSGMAGNELTGHQTAQQATETSPSPTSSSLSASSPDTQSPASETPPRLELPLTPLPIDEPASPLPLTAPPPFTASPPSSPTPRPKGLSPRKRLLIALFVLLFLLASSSIVALYVFRVKRPGLPIVVGDVIFLNSGQLNAQNSQGVDDEVQVYLHNIPNPASGKSYYAWLKNAPIEDEGTWVLLGTLHVNQGNAQLPSPYQDPQHSDLLLNASSFLVTEEDSNIPPTEPSTDISTWFFYSEPAQVTLLHLRHLLANSPELDIRQLYGGLGIWFWRNTEKIVEWAGSARDDVENNPPATDVAHRQLIRILDYIDGEDSVSMDVASNTPLLVSPHDAQIALVGPPPHLEPPGSLYKGEVPPGYVYLMRVHLDAAVSTPQATAEQRQLANQIENSLNQVVFDLEQVRQDARRLVALNGTQLGTPQAQSILNDLAAAAQSAYAGPINPSQPQGGANWIYTNLQRMATFEVQPYTAQ